MCCSERIVNVAVSVACESFCEFLLALFHFFLGCVVCWVFFVDANRLAFLFRIEAEVFEKKHFARFQSCCGVGCLGAVRSELYVCAESGSYGVLNLAQGKFCVYFAFRLAHVRHNYESAAVGKNFFQSWEGTADTGVVSDFAVFVQWHVEVNAHNRFFTCEVVLFDCHFIEN